MLATVVLDGAEYGIGKVDAITQFHIARRIAPVQVALGVSFAELASVLPPPPSPGEKPTPPNLEDEAKMAASFKPVLDIVSSMSDEDVNYVIKAAMVAVKRKDGDRWAVVHTGTQFVYQDITMPVMVRLVVEVIKANLGDFFSPLLGAMPSGASS